jgi:ribonucleoside-triphosphate reductase
VASCQYGGQSISLTHLAPFVDVSRKKIRRQVIDELNSVGVEPDAEKLAKIVEGRVREEIRRGVQTIQYQVVTLMTTNGQAPFVTVFMYLGEAKDPQLEARPRLVIEETLRQRYQGVKNEKGVWITPAFPKLIYVLEEDNIRPGQPYFYLTELAAKCTAKRMVPDYISEKKMRELKLSKGEQPGEGDVYTCMGCRSFLTPDRSGNGYDNVANAGNYEPGKPKYYGRFNQGVVTINLPDVALSSGGDMDRFWEIFDERLELCHRALRCRHERLKGTLSDAAPILWQYGALARLKKGETIDKLLYGGYSTISLGYAGLYECTKAMTGVSPHRPEGQAVRAAGHAAHERQVLRVEGRRGHRLLALRHAARVHHLQVRQVAAAQLRHHPGHHRQGLHHELLPRARDREDRRLPQARSRASSSASRPAEPSATSRSPTCRTTSRRSSRVLQFIYDNIMYAELNTKSDYCQKCGYDGEIRSWRTTASWCGSAPTAATATSPR